MQGDPYAALTGNRYSLKSAAVFVGCRHVQQCWHKSKDTDYSQKLVDLLLSNSDIMAVIFQLLLVLSAAVGSAQGFVSTQSPIKTAISRTVVPRQTERLASYLQSSKEEEIAELERKLQQLKQEAAQEEGAVASPPPPPAFNTIPPPPTVQAAPAPAQEDENADVSEDFMLSEKWKESQPVGLEEEGGGFGSALTGILGGIGLAVFIALFSQVPVGQENYSKYAALDAPKEVIDLGDLNRARSSSGDL